MYYLKQFKHNKEYDFIYRLSLIVGTVILILAWPLSFILPVSISFENALLENLQVIVLILGSIYNLSLVQRSRNRQIEDFHIWCAVLMIFMSFRELSWGRVFYPIDVEKTGPVFVAMSDFTWKNEVHVIMAIIILFLLVFMFKRLPIMRMLHSKIPFLIVFLMIVAAVFSYVGDYGIVVGKLHGQIVEEFGELAFYVLIPALCIHYNRELSN